MRKNKRWIMSLVGWIMSLTILLSPLQGVAYAAEDVGAIMQESESASAENESQEAIIGESESSQEDESSPENELSPDENPF